MTDHAPMFLTSERHYGLGETPARIAYQPRHSLACGLNPSTRYSYSPAHSKFTENQLLFS